MTIQMQWGSANGNLKLPAPSSGTVVAFTNGVGSIPVQDVPTMLLNGAVVMAGQNWPGASVKHMTPPVGGLWPSTGTITSPDGQSITITGGVALVPIAWVNYYVGMGWTVTGWGE
jgi:hypothetical protein